MAIDEDFLSGLVQEFPATKAAVRRLAERRVYTPQKFRELSDAARGRAFTVTADISNKTRAKMQNKLTELIAEGADRKAFAKEFETLPMSPAHIDQVFRNNVFTAYSEGVEDVLATPMVGENFPYRQYYATMDDRVRPEHLLLETLGIQGTGIYHKDDPVWRMFRPPWSWNCRCVWRPVSIREAARKGINEAKQWLETGEEPPHEFVKRPPFEPDPLWLRSHADISG